LDRRRSNPDPGPRRCPRSCLRQSPSLRRTRLRSYGMCPCVRRWHRMRWWLVGAGSVGTVSLTYCVYVARGVHCAGADMTHTVFRFSLTVTGDCIRNSRVCA
jgi:hypothetical protein